MYYCCTALDAIAANNVRINFVDYNGHWKKGITSSKSYNRYDIFTPNTLRIFGWDIVYCAKLEFSVANKKQS